MWPCPNPGIRKISTSCQMSACKTRHLCPDADSGWTDLWTICPVTGSGHLHILTTFCLDWHLAVLLKIQFFVWIRIRLFLLLPGVLLEAGVRHQWPFNLFLSHVDVGEYIVLKPKMWWCDPSVEAVQSKSDMFRVRTREISCSQTCPIVE